MRRTIVRTAEFTRASQSAILGIPYEVRNNTTLNQALEIQQSATLTEGTYPKIGYYAIGNGGHKMALSSNNRSYPAPVDQKPNHNNLYNLQPMVLRLQTDDLTPEQRANYGLRRAETHDGLNYFAYYLKRLDKTNWSATTVLTTVEDGNSDASIYTPTDSDLHPVPPELSPEGSIATLGEGSYLSVNIPVTINLSPEDVAEYIEVCKILDGDENLAIISEVALVMGVDRSITTEGTGGSTINFNEVVAAQCAFYMPAFRPLTYENDGGNFTLELGATEPLTTSSSTAPIE